MSGNRAADISTRYKRHRVFLKIDGIDPKQAFTPKLGCKNKRLQFLFARPPYTIASLAIACRLTCRAR